jgi:hypothetical protein
MIAARVWKEWHYSCLMIFFPGTCSRTKSSPRSSAHHEHAFLAQRTPALCDRVVQCWPAKICCGVGGFAWRWCIQPAQLNCYERHCSQGNCGVIHAALSERKKAVRRRPSGVCATSETLTLGMSVAKKSARKIKNSCTHLYSIVDASAICLSTGVAEEPIFRDTVRH